MILLATLSFYNNSLQHQQLTITTFPNICGTRGNILYLEARKFSEIQKEFISEMLPANIDLLYHGCTWFGKFVDYKDEKVIHIPN